MPELESRMRDADFWPRVGQTISRTRNVSAQSLATDFFKLPKETPEKSESLTAYVSRALPKSFFHYVLDKTLTTKDCPEPSKESIDAHKGQRTTRDEGENRILWAIQKFMKVSQHQTEYDLTPVEKDIKQQLEEFEGYWPKINSSP
jgi:hypothetical protein